jgi:tRNA threonylcarbamoyladenosine biosynthesis protein TsaB
MKLLAFETATEACSVALWIDGTVRARHELAPRRHAALALPWADALLAEAGIARTQLDAIAVGIGPGAFTGVRLAVALAQGIALGLDVPVLPVSTLAVLAMSALPREGAIATGDAPTGLTICAAIDARMDEVYLGRFRADDEGLVVASGRELLVAPDAAPFAEAVDAIGIGTGFAARGGALAQRLAPSRVVADALPHATDLARLAARDFTRGLAIAADALEPAYLRDRVALTLVEQGKA